jgi:hypothetical protein
VEVVKVRSYPVGFALYQTAAAIVFSESAERELTWTRAQRQPGTVPVAVVVGRSMIA